jgi:hypothetical protein
LNNYEFDKANPIVLEIIQLFNINLDSLKKLEPKEREKMLQEMLQSRIEESIKIVDKGKPED